MRAGSESRRAALGASRRSAPSPPSPQRLLPLPLQAGEDERAHALGIVAADLLRDVVLEGAVAVALPLLGIAAQPGHLADAVDVHQAVRARLDELLQEPVVRAPARLAVPGVDVAQA